MDPAHSHVGPRRAGVGLTADDLQPLLGRLAVADQDADAELARNAVRARLFGGKTKKTRVGKYTLGKLVGSGGMGKVYAAHDRELDRSVAIKLLKGTPWTGAATEAARLRREARTLAQVSHRNVVSVYEVGETDMGVFVAMEYIRGRTLRAWVNAEDPSPHAVLEVLREAGRGLAAVHAAGIVHRDFKPDNVLIGDDGRVCVVDFGIAHEVPDQKIERRDIESTTGRAKFLTSGPAGTPAYMAPERLDGRDAEVAGDVYAFCLSTWEALTGQLPDPFIVAAPADPQGVVPRRLRAILRRGLEHDPTKRPASIEEVLAAFDRDLRPARSRSWLWLGVAALGLGLGVGAALWTPASPTARLVPSFTFARPEAPKLVLAERLVLGPEQEDGLRFVGRDPPRGDSSPPEYGAEAMAARAPGVRVVADGFGGTISRTTTWQHATIDYLGGVRAWADAHADGRFPADVLGLHVEPRDTRVVAGLMPEASHMHTAVAAVVDWRDRHAPGLPLWVTRFGYDTHPRSPLRPSAIEGVAPGVVHGQWCARGALLLLAGGAERVRVGRWADGDTSNTAGMTAGLRGPAPEHAPKPALQMLETLAEAAGAFTIEGWVEGLPRDVWALSLAHSDGRRGTVAWLGTATGQHRRVSLPFEPDGDVTLTPLAGVERTVPGGTLQLELSETPLVAVW